MPAPHTIHEWMKTFDGIYHDANAARTPEQLWIGVSNHCSAIAEGLRSIEFEKILREAAHAFEWMCAFSTTLQRLPRSDVFSFTENLSSMVGMKYPNVCGHCLGNPCGCNSVEIDAQVDKPGRYAQLQTEWNRHRTSISEYTLRDWQQVFLKIYRQNVHLLTPEAIGFHFLEEVGEEGHAMRVLSELRGVVREGHVDGKFVERLSSGDSLSTAYLEHEGPASKERARISASGGSEALKAEKARILKSHDRKLIERRLSDAKMHVITELADTFAWLCSVLNKIWMIAVQNGAWSVPGEGGLPQSETVGMIVGPTGDPISAIENAIVREYYRDGNTGNAPWCPACMTEKKCSCLFSFVT